MIELPPYISYSQANTYLGCPRSWYLSYVQKAEQVQTYYLPIGTAAHQMIETHLKGEPELSAEEVFWPLVSAQLLIEPDQSKWLAGGPKADPTVGPKALQKVKDCYERALEFLEDVDVWEVEYDASGSLPGLSVPIKAFVDIVGEHKKHGPVILDWKTGSSKPKDAFQLETYAALLDHNAFKNALYTTESFKGLWAMLDPRAAKARPIDLSAVDPREIGAKYQAVRKGMESMFIPAKKKFMCKMCFQKSNCTMYDLTPRSAYYDRSHDDQPPF